MGARWELEDSVVFIVFVERKKPGDNDQSRDQRLLGTREETGELRGKLIPINLTSEFFFRHRHIVRTRTFQRSVT